MSYSIKRRSFLFASLAAIPGVNVLASLTGIARPLSELTIAFRHINCSPMTFCAMPDGAIAARMGGQLMERKQEFIFAADGSKVPSDRWSRFIFNNGDLFAEARVNYLYAQWYVDFVQVVRPSGSYQEMKGLMPGIRQWRPPEVNWEI